MDTVLVFCGITSAHESLFAAKIHEHELREERSGS